MVRCDQSAATRGKSEYDARTMLAQSLGRISLVLVLAFSAFVELLCNRVGVHVASPAARAGSTAYRIVDALGLFTFYLSGLLALVVLAWAIVVLIADGRLLRLGNRIALMLAAAAFLPLAATGLVFRLPDALGPWLNITFGVLVVTIVLGFLLRPAGVRAKLGVIYLAAPLLLHCYWLATRQMPELAPIGQQADLPALLLEKAEHLVIVGAFASFLFFIPFSRWAALIEPVPVALAMALTAGLGMVVSYQNGLATRAARFGLGLNLPGITSREVLQLAFYIAAFFFFALLLLTLLLRGRNERSLGMGLLLLALSGFHLELPYQLLLTGVALLQITRALTALHAAQAAAVPPLPRPSPAQWKAYLERLAQTLGLEAAEAVVLQSESNQIARVRGQKQDLPVSVRLQLRQGALQELEVDVGIAPKEDAPASLLRRQGRRGERVVDGRAERLKDFSPLFVARDSTGQLADGVAPLAEQFERLLHGWLGIWPAEGVQYVMRPLADGWPIAQQALAADPEAESPELVALIELMLALAERFEVR